MDRDETQEAELKRWSEAEDARDLEEAKAHWEAEADQADAEDEPEAEAA